MVILLVRGARTDLHHVPEGLRFLDACGISSCITLVQGPDTEQQ
jgi:hypothetical protein